MIHASLLNYWKNRNTCDKFVPKKNSKKKNNISAPWLSKELKQLIRKKKNSRYKNCAAKWGNEATKKEFNQTKKEVTAKPKQARKTFEKNLVEEAKKNPRIFFRNANSQKKSKQLLELSKHKMALEQQMNQPKSLK